MKPQRQHLQPLATLQFIAVIAIVLAHYWLDGATYLKTLCTSFCFVYSGYFTARAHHDSRFSLAGHTRYMLGKLAKFYPLYVLALGLSLLAAYFISGLNLLFSKVTLAHLLLLSPWFTTPSYYFGINPVAWFICDLFFLYLISPLLIGGMRHLKPWQQAAVVAMLIVGELVAGYAANPASPSLLISHQPHYYLYEFPPVRMLEFLTGIALYHITLGQRWRNAAARLSPTAATIIEMVTVAACIAFYPIGEQLLFPHWYRAYCSVAPVVIAMMGALVFTSSRGGLVSRAMSWPPLAALSRIGAEVYLLQFGAYYCIKQAVQLLGLPTHGVAYFVLQTGGLLLVAWAVHHRVVVPLRRLLSR